MKKLQKALRIQNDRNKKIEQEIYGTLGIPLGGQKLVEVPGRNSYVYVKLRDNQNEVIQAFNNKVAASYNLPVIIHREGTRYIVDGVNTQRYQNNWNNFAPYLPKHGVVHSFYDGGGGDISWIYSRQFMPYLVYPESSLTGTAIKVSPHILLNSSNQWRTVGGTGTPSVSLYLPTGGSDAIMGLIYIDASSGNPQLLINSGTPFSSLLTGTGDVFQYIPIPNPNTQIPLAAVRLVSGTNINWDSLYDVRQWVHTQPSGTSGGGGGSSIDTLGFAGLDEGVPIGTGTFLNVVGAGATFTRSGTMFNLNIPGSSPSASSPLPVFGNGQFVVSGTALRLDGNVTVTTSGTQAVVNFPVTTYFRVGQPTTLSHPSGLFWKVPDGVYASGSLGVFIQGHALIPGIDYNEQLYVSGTYQYLSAPPTGSYHLVHYGVPCVAQPHISTGSFTGGITDSNGVLLVDSNGTQILDSNGN